MFSSANLCYDSTRYKLDLPRIAELLKDRTPWDITFTEWAGFGVVIPQLLVHSPVPFLIQIEDDTEVQEEVQEIIEWEHLDPDGDIARKLARCNARLGIQSTAPDQVSVNNGVLQISAIGGTVDPADVEITKVLQCLGREIEGILHDCVNGGLTVF
jgi:hypothetical protein